MPSHATDERTRLIRETNARFWTLTGHKVGRRLNMSDPKDRQMSAQWLAIYEAVRAVRSRATSLARSAARSSGSQLVWVAEKSDGTMEQIADPEANLIDNLFASSLIQPDQFRYTAQFDFRRSPNPISDRYGSEMQFRTPTGPLVAREMRNARR